MLYVYTSRRRRFMGKVRLLDLAILYDYGRREDAAYGAAAGHGAHFGAGVGVRGKS
jgi:hypothetical protein